MENKVGRVIASLGERLFADVFLRLFGSPGRTHTA